MAGSEPGLDTSGSAALGDPARELIRLRDRLIITGWVPGADRELARLAEEAVRPMADVLRPGASVVAIGGFGRGSLALRSDLDLLVLTPDGAGAPEVAAALAPLRGTGLRVACAVHTPQAARELAGRRLDAISLFLTARLLAGDPTTFHAFRSRFALLIDREYGRIVEGMAREEARRRTEDPYRSRAVDLKTGRGGLRTLDMLDWRRRLGAAAGMPVGDPAGVEREAREALTALRSGLHAVAGPVERLSPRLVGPVAAWLRVSPETAVELQRRIARTAEAQVDGSWPEVVRLLAPAERRTLPEPDAPVLAAAVRFARRPERAPVPGRGAPDRWTAADRAAVLALCRPEHRTVLDRLLAAGWLGSILPEIDRLFSTAGVAVRAQRRSPGGHTLALLDALAGMDHPAPGAGTDRELLLWAAILHDVGVGVAGEEGHAGRSAALAERIGLRIGLTAGAVETVGRVVRLHPLLVGLARGRRFEDPVSVAAAARRIGDLRTLELLLPLTVADLRAWGLPLRRIEDRVRRAHRAVERRLRHPDDPASGVPM